MPSVLAPLLGQNRSVADGMLAALRFTPPLAAAAAMTAPHQTASLGALALVAGWCMVFIFAIALLERMRATPRAFARAAISWGGPCDRIGRLFGAQQGALVAKMLRYYLRNTRVRMNLVVGPALALVLMTQPAPHGPQSKFLLALPVMAIVGFLASFSMSVNVLGYEAGGFRRYLLLPVSPSMLVRATSIPPLMLGAAMIPALIAAWLAIAPVHTDARMLTMLSSSAAGGLLLFTALAIWTTLLWPRKTEFTSSFGNNLSLGGNMLVLAAFGGAISGSMLLARFGRFEAVLAWWWAAPFFVLFGAAVWGITLRTAPAVFAARRERLLAVLEGRR